MGRFTKWLFDHNPRTGRMILEDGSFINEADFLYGTSVGVKAYIVQPYTEANVKRGLQFYFRASYPTADTIASTDTRKIYFATGSKQVLVKLRIVEYVGQELAVQIYDGPTGVAGGTPITPSNYNRVAPVASTVTVTKDVSTTTDGAPFEAEPEYFFGASNQPARDVNAIPQGRERVLPPNTEYVIAITNNDNSAPARVQYFLDWYEGETDI